MGLELDVTSFLEREKKFERESESSEKVYEAMSAFKSGVYTV